MTGFIGFLSSAWGVIKSIPTLLDLIERVLGWAEDAIRSFRLNQLKRAITEAGQKSAKEKDQRDLEKIINNGGGFISLDWLLVIAGMIAISAMFIGCKTVAPKVPARIWVVSNEHGGLTRVDDIDGKEIRTTYKWGDPRIDGATSFLRDPPEYNFESFYYSLVSRCKEWEDHTVSITSIKKEFDEERERASLHDDENLRPTQ